MPISCKQTKVQGNANKLQTINANDDYFRFLDDDTCVQISNLEAEFEKSPEEISDDDLMHVKDHAWNRNTEEIRLNFE